MRLACFALVGVFASSSAGEGKVLLTQAQSSTSTAPQSTYIRVATPPATLESLAAASPIIILGRIRASGRPKVAGDQTNVIRGHAVTVTEVIKSSGRSIPGEIELRQYGGTAEKDGRLVSTQYTERILNTGEQVVLFLTPAKDGSGYWLTGGDAGAYLITSVNGVLTVNPSKDARHYALFEGRSMVSASDFVAVLRNLSKTR
jgi:hypothetical protein